MEQNQAKDAVQVRCLLISISMVLMDKGNQLSFEEAFAIAVAVEGATDATCSFAREEILEAHRTLSKNGETLTQMTLTRDEARSALEEILRVPRLQRRFGTNDVLP